MTADDLERFWAKVEKLAGCWVWTAGLDADGYGEFAVPLDGSWKRRRYFKAHRFSWELVNGPPQKLVLHKCDNRRCVRVDHLFEGDHVDNIKDCLQKGRFVRGERQRQAKLTESGIRQIRQLHTNGRSLRSLGKEFGVSTSAISSVVQRKTWRHVV